MDLSEIKELIAVMRKNKIAEIDLEQDGSRVRIVATGPPVKSPPPAPAPPASVPVATYAHPPQFAPTPVAPPSEAAARVAAPVEPTPPAEEKVEGTEITSPMVGTFYRSPAPDAPSYVDVGAVVNDDTVLCIIEAMKLMNEIKAEMRGKIIEILVESGQPVEFGQPLFLLEKS